MKQQTKEIPLLVKFLICIMASILICWNCISYCGVKTYNNSINDVIYQASPQSNVFFVTIDNYKQELQENEYSIASITIDFEKLQSYAYCLNFNNKGNLSEQLLHSLITNINAIDIEINSEHYYFKSDKDAQAFLDKIFSYKEVEYQKSEKVINISQITSNSTIENKIQEIKTQKEKEDLEAAQKRKRESYTVTSRGSSTTRAASYAGGAPIESYVYISSYYGETSSVRSSKHTGVDFAAAAGTRIYAWKNGTVTSAQWSGSYGNFIIIDHGDGTVSRYGHLSNYAVSAGQTVTKGQVIGYVGSTGNSTGPHLHFEVLINGSFVNPLNYLN